MATAVNDNNFQSEVLDSDMPVLVDFWATWCGPCRQVAAVLDKVSPEYENKIKFVKVDVDQNPQSTIKYNVRSIPTLILFKTGAPIDQIVGAVPEGVLKKSLDKAVT